MTFPLMPASGAPPFQKGVLTYRSATLGTVNIGNSSEDRWVIVGATVGSGGGIPVFTPATCNGVNMTLLVEDYSTLGDDGQRSAFWIARVPQGSTATLVTPSGGGNFVATLTGVRDPVGTVKLGVSGTAISNAVPACALAVWMCNFGSVTAVTNMSAAPNSAFGNGSGYAVNYETTANPTTYTATGSRIAIFRVISWAFSY